LYVPFLAAFFEIPSNTISFTMITTLSLSLVTYTALQILIKKISTTDTFVHLSLKNH
jgi:hypothetical protein